MSTFDSIFLEEDKSNAQSASNMIANVSIAYNANDASQRNAVFQAQQKISKAQKRREVMNDRKQKAGVQVQEENKMYNNSDMALLEFSSIFHEGSEPTEKELRAELDKIKGMKDSSGDKIIAGIGRFLTCMGSIDLVINAAFLLPVGVIFSALELYAGQKLSQKSKKGKLQSVSTKCDSLIKKYSKELDKQYDAKQRKILEKNIEALEEIRDEAEKLSRRSN